MAITTAVYNVPPRPSNEKGARELSDFREQRGKRTIDVRRRMIFVRWASIAGNPKVLAREAKESPIMIE